MNVLDNSLSDSGSVDIETCHGSPENSPTPPEEMTSVADSLSPVKGVQVAAAGADATGEGAMTNAGVTVAANRVGLTHVSQLYTIEAILGLNHTNPNGNHPPIRYVSIVFVMNSEIMMIVRLINESYDINQAPLMS